MGIPGSKIIKGNKGNAWIARTQAILQHCPSKHVIRCRHVVYAITRESKWEAQKRNVSGDKENGERAERKAALQATGALRITPSDLLFSHTDMLPLSLHIKLLCQRAALRITTLPKEHPLFITAKRAMGRRIRRHTSPLYKILQLAKIKANAIEIIGILPKPPTWRNKIKTLIMKDRDEAEQMTRDDESDIKIYTDGSSHDGGVGASAVLLHGI